jgi:NAD(P)-dependent dehydrogenase (short-subunit alcohol dehydrogenase family)
VSDWDPARLPDRSGRTVVVTGGNAGIGFGIARQVAAAGARVVLASRSPEKAEAAIAAIRAETPGASLGFVRLDLASLGSVRTAAAELRALGAIDVLVNNAGRTDSVRGRQTTEDGLELITGTNAFGPFALTALVAPALAEDGRVVWLGSLSTRMIHADDDLQSARSYSPFRAYGRSKHALHAIGFELARRWTASGSSRRSLVAHPGYAVDRRPVPPLSQLKERGAWPAVRAALDPDAASGSFWGPGGLLALTGRPAPGVPVAASAEPAYGQRVWAEAERATGVDFRP